MSKRLSVCAVALVAGSLMSVSAAMAQDLTNPGDLITPSSPNHPAGEPASAAIDNTAETKYLNFDRLDTGFTVTPSNFGVVRSLAIITANDAPARDPVSFTLEGSDDGVNFTLIASGPLNPLVTRFALSEVSFDNSTAYAQYRVTFPTIRTFSSANSMQVAEVQLNTAADITSAADAVSVTYTDGASSAAGEGVTNLIDDRLGTKFAVTNGNLGPTTIDLIPSIGSTVVTGIDVFSGPDDAFFPGRTPGSLTLLGSNDGTNYTEIFATTVFGFIFNYEDQQFFIDNSTAYNRYRIVLGPSFDPIMQLGEIRLVGTASMSPPANDECAGALAITAGDTAAGNAFATGSDLTPCGSQDTTDVWYAYTATASGTVEVNTCGVGTIDTTLAVYAACGGALLGCDDNTCGSGARVRWEAQSGQTYLVRAAGVDGATGGFTLTLDDSPEVHDDVAIPLAYNFNGMVHDGEAGEPDNPDGFRSISDRALAITGVPGSIEVGLEGTTGISYDVVEQADVLDIVHLGNRNATDGGLQAFDAAPDGDNIGIQPNWLPNPDQTGMQTTDVASLNLVMGPETRIGVLYHISNGGGDFGMSLQFVGGQSVGVLLNGPDWFGDQNPFPPSPGVESQAQLGTFIGADSNDAGNPGVPLNVVEAVVSIPDLLADGFGNFEGLQLQSISFFGATNVNAGHAIFAATVRDAIGGGPECPADWNMDGNVNSNDISAFLTAWLSSVQMGNLIADFNDDNLVNSNDISAFLTAWLGSLQGC